MVALNEQFYQNDPKARSSGATGGGARRWVLSQSSLKRVDSKIQRKKPVQSAQSVDASLSVPLAADFTIHRSLVADRQLGKNVKTGWVVKLHAKVTGH